MLLCGVNMNLTEPVDIMFKYSLPDKKKLAEALQAKTRNSDAISYSDNYVFSANTVNQIRAQLSRLAPGTKAGGGANPVVLITINDPLIAGDPAMRFGTTYWF